MRKSLATALILPALALLFAGCGEKSDSSTPVACLTGSGIWKIALADVPEEVLIEQETPISDCLLPDQPAGQQEQVGQTAIALATELAATVQGQGSGPAFDPPAREFAALQAGYLVGALEKGASRSEGIHATLVTRVEAAATNRLDQASQQTQAAFRQGREAGLEFG